MGNKISEEAVLPISYDFFMAHRKCVIPLEGMDTSKPDGLAAYGAYCAQQFAIFHKGFYSQLLAELESDK